jgi:hypothetical protein
MVMHQFLGTAREVAELLSPILKQLNIDHIIDIGSGSGGPMPEVLSQLNNEHKISNLRLTLTDLYPSSPELTVQNSNIDYDSRSIDATSIPKDLKGMRTMVASFHHMKPEKAKRILESAMNAQAPICIFEISDNGFPLILNFLALPINFIMAFIVTLWVRPFTLAQLFFTLPIPILPLSFAWDGAVSNMRTYTLSDLNELLVGLENPHYQWTKGVISGRGKKLYLIGMPITPNKGSN